MIIKLFYILSLNLSLMSMNMNHPLSLGLILILQTFTTTIIMGLMSQTFWFSYILFLVMIGGMLIIFIYIISLIFNKIFMQTLNMMMLYIFILSLILYLIMNSFKINSLENLMNYKLINEISFNLIKLYNFPVNLINLMMISYLFFLLIVVVKITNFFYGPLRMKI